MPCLAHGKGALLFSSLTSAVCVLQSCATAACCVLGDVLWPGWHRGHSGVTWEPTSKVPGVPGLVPAAEGPACSWVRSVVVDDMWLRGCVVAAARQLLALCHGV